MHKALYDKGPQLLCDFLYMHFYFEFKKSYYLQWSLFPH